MPKVAREMSALEVSRLNIPGHYAVGGVAGLYLYINDANAKSWVLRLMVGLQRRHIGIGGYPTVTLAQAKEKARKLREEVRNGHDPIQQRKDVVSKLKAKQASAITFQQAAEGYLASHGDTWRNAKHRAQWTSTLTNYVYPVIGDLLIQDIEIQQVLSVLTPIWKTKNETASRIRGRIESVLDWAKARNYRSGENPARWKGLLDKLLPAPSKVKVVNHHRAMAIDEAPTFISRLRLHEGIAALALEFLILCAARSGEVRGACWSEIDIEARLWTIPRTRMKAGKEHRVPLNPQAIEILSTIQKSAETNLIFVAPKGGELSDMTLTAVMRRMKVDAVPHGFRSTFRDWVGERTNYPRELAEQALAHAIENKVEAAYRRGDALDKRRVMMSDWGNFLSSD
ncbi:MAG: integrase arm-type DNA-binding domain-containing protein [Methylicorpusculum sp.]|uniref:tyrosine-type recombinase/integrase n=1 Tax=Methylicorpusculum sp. TaxID=2713644 RepID=UPI00272227DB|nr:site-specific integrase [Methylicorpusculum sp.]MDO8940616.1 integrase arm-type DNA-binding domain-containing protein [Methylicorpusculum sp.]